MKQFLTMSFMVLGIIFGASAQNRSINFIEGKTFEEIKELAKKQNKLIFMDFYTTWCGPCKMMDKKVFTNDSVADFCNTHFINIKIDAEGGEGVELRKKYEVKRYPTFIFISNDGEMLHRSCGSKQPAEFIQVGFQAIDPEKQNSKSISAYRKGNRDPKFVSRLIISLGSDIALLGNILPDYLAGQNDTDLFSKENWEIINRHVYDFESREFQFVFNQQERFSLLYGDSVVREKICRIFSNKFFQLAHGTSADKEKQFESLKEKIQKSGLSQKDKFLYEADLVFYEGIENWKRFAEAALDIVEQYYWNNPDKLSYLAGSFYEHVSDTVMLKKAMLWIKRSIELKDSPESRDIQKVLSLKLNGIKK